MDKKSLKNLGGRQMIHREMENLADAKAKWIQTNLAEQLSNPRKNDESAYQPLEFMAEQCIIRN